jgi:hypothetical protein
VNVFLDIGNLVCNEGMAENLRKAHEDRIKVFY